MTGIYKITNVVNGKCYIGSALNIKRRWQKHKAELRYNKHHSIKLQRAWNKYGEDAFEFIILLKCAKEELIIKEQSFIDWLKPEYNVLKIAGSQMGYKHTEEAKVLISLSKKGKQHSKEHRLKLSEVRKGVKIGPFSEETKAKMRKPKTKETRSKMSEAQKGNKKFLGHKHSDETLLFMSESKKGEKNPNFGKSPSPETIAKRVISLKASWARRKENQCQ